MLGWCVSRESPSARLLIQFGLGLGAPCGPLCGHSVICRPPAPTPPAPAEVEAASVAGGPAAAAHHPGRTPRTRRAGRTHVNPAVEPTPADLATEAVLTLF